MWATHQLGALTVPWVAALLKLALSNTLVTNLPESLQSTLKALANLMPGCNVDNVLVLLSTGARDAPHQNCQSHKLETPTAVESKSRYWHSPGDRYRSVACLHLPCWSLWAAQDQQHTMPEGASYSGGQQCC